MKVEITQATKACGWGRSLERLPTDFLDLDFIKDHFELNDKGELLIVKDFRNHLKYRYAQKPEVKKNLSGEKYITIADREYLMAGIIAALDTNKEVSGKKIYFKNNDSNSLHPKEPSC